MKNVKARSAAQNPASESSPSAQSIRPSAAVSVLANSIVIVSDPAGADVTVDGGGVVTLTLTNNGGANRTFTYTVNDNLGATSNAASVEVQVD